MLQKLWQGNNYVQIKHWEESSIYEHLDEISIDHESDINNNNCPKDVSTDETTTKREKQYAKPNCVGAKKTLSQVKETATVNPKERSYDHEHQSNQPLIKKDKQYAQVHRPIERSYAHVHRKTTTYQTIEI